MKEITLQELKQVAKKVESNLKALNIPISDISEIVISNSSSRNLGQCRFNRARNTYSIIIFNTITHDIKKVENTLYHEYLHTVKGCMNHCDKWKMYASRVNSAYGTDVRRTNAIQIPEEKYSEFKYVFKCKNCGKTSVRNRASNFTKYYEEYTCGTCGIGTFEQVK